METAPVSGAGLSVGSVIGVTDGTTGGVSDGTIVGVSDGVTVGTSAVTAGVIVGEGTGVFVGNGTSLFLFAETTFTFTQPLHFLFFDFAVTVIFYSCIAFAIPPLQNYPYLYKMAG